MQCIDLSFYTNQFEETMKLQFPITLLFIFALLTGCSSKYAYHVKPTPLKEGTTKYYLDETNVELTLGYGALDDGRFESKQQLTDSFKKHLIKNLKEQNILAESKSRSDALLVVNVDFHRVFNAGGKALNKPVISYSINVKNKEQVKLASFKMEKFQTSYGTFGDIAVNVKIVAFKWVAEDELKDVNLVSKMITEDLYKLGD